MKLAVYCIKAKMSHLNKKYTKFILAVTLLVLLVWAIAGCEDYEQWSPTQPAEEETQEEMSPTVIKTEDVAIMAVYEHLLSKAKSYQAKQYLADFYFACDNWSASSELLKDGSRMWYIIVDMTGVEGWEERLYWQQASWFILQDGKVLPSNRLEANALRIEADLQELSLPSHTQEDEGG